MKAQPPLDAQGNRVKTAWSDPDHVRLTQQSPEELLASKESERLHERDPDDPWGVEPPRTETDCQCSDVDPCPCDRDDDTYEYDGLCGCCREGYHNGGCAEVARS